MFDSLFTGHLRLIKCKFQTPELYHAGVTYSLFTGHLGLNPYFWSLCRAYCVWQDLNIVHDIFTRATSQLVPQTEIMTMAWILAPGKIFFYYTCSTLHQYSHPVLCFHAKDKLNKAGSILENQRENHVYDTL